MTHKDIYEKFMIEYDKANITSSYPSLTKYEIATLLDKAYLALISQKLTANNSRKVGFESDVKIIEDLRPLLKQEPSTRAQNSTFCSSNEIIYNIPNDMLYYIQSHVVDGQDAMNVRLVSHDSADKFRVTNVNMPWIATPVAFIENSEVHTLFDAINKPTNPELVITYIKTPNKFIIDSVESDDPEDDTPDNPNIPDNPSGGDDVPDTPDVPETPQDESIVIDFMFQVEEPYLIAQPYSKYGITHQTLIKAQNDEIDVYVNYDGNKSKIKVVDFREISDDAMSPIYDSIQRISDVMDGEDILWYGVYEEEQSAVAVIFGDTKLTCLF